MQKYNEKVTQNEILCDPNSLFCTLLSWVSVEWEKIWRFSRRPCVGGGLGPKPS